MNEYSSSQCDLKTFIHKWCRFILLIQYNIGERKRSNNGTNNQMQNITKETQKIFP